MDEIINEIIEIEKRAQNIMKEARDMKEELLSTIDHDIEKMKESYLSRANDRIKFVREDEDKNTAKAIEKIDNEKSQVLNKLQSNYDTNASAWVDTMFNNIVNS
ncbi:MAG: hypothetical protein RR306_00695 [Clostridia bacterium]